MVESTVVACNRRLRKWIEPSKTRACGCNRDRLSAIERLEFICNDLEVLLEKALSASQELLSPSIRTLLGQTFETEFLDLEYVYGKSGTCTAFLLRKILEKAAFIALSKKGAGGELNEGNGHIKGLDLLLDLAAKEQVKGHPIIMPKTRKAIHGIKFLGDSAAHNPLVIVDMHEITPQLPYITTALKEIGISIQELS